MKLLSLLAFLLHVAIMSLAQGHEAFTLQIKRLYQLSSKEEINQAWQDLIEAKDIPFVREDSVAFLYRGDVGAVSWMGDFNGWGYDKNFNN